MGKVKGPVTGWGSTKGSLTEGSHGHLSPEGAERGTLLWEPVAMREQLPKGAWPSTEEHSPCSNTEQLGHNNTPNSDLLLGSPTGQIQLEAGGQESLDGSSKESQPQGHTHTGKKGGGWTCRGTFALYYLQKSRSTSSCNSLLIHFKTHEQGCYRIKCNQVGKGLSTVWYIVSTQ